MSESPDNSNMQEETNSGPDSEAKEQRLKRPSWVRRHPKSSIAFLVLFLIIGPYLQSRLTSSSRRVRMFELDKLVERTESETLTIAVWNIAHGRGQAKSNWDGGAAAKQTRVSRIADLLEMLDSDIAVLNEVDFNSTWSGHRNQAEMIAQQVNFGYRVEQPNLDFRFLYGSFRFGNAILSKYPIADAKYVEYPALNQWEPILAGKKGGCVATVHLGQGRFIQIFAVHIEHRDENIRYESAQRLIAATVDGPTILAGDFNSTPTGFPGHVQTSDGNNALEFILKQKNLQTRLTDPSQPGPFTFPSDEPAKTIDWVFVSDHFEVEGHYVIDSEDYSHLSDHLPLVVQLKLKKPPASKSAD